jgi:hypothetical protein
VHSARSNAEGAVKERGEKVLGFPLCVDHVQVVLVVEDDWEGDGAAVEGDIEDTGKTAKLELESPAEVLRRSKIYVIVDFTDRPA